MVGPGRDVGGHIVAPQALAAATHLPVLLMGERPTPARPGDARARLDFGWWASNGPTGGYLASLALNHACEETDLDPTQARSVELSVLRPAAADAYVTDVSIAAGPTRIALATVTFTQDEPFAQASIYFSPPVDGSIPGDCKPPGALPPEAYAEIGEQQAGRATRHEPVRVSADYGPRRTRPQSRMGPRVGTSCAADVRASQRRASRRQLVPTKPHACGSELSHWPRRIRRAADGKSSRRFHRLPSAGGCIPKRELRARR